MSGRWTFDHDRLVLDLCEGDGKWIYEIDLERCRTSAEVLEQSAGRVTPSEKGWP